MISIPEMSDLEVAAEIKTGLQSLEDNFIHQFPGFVDSFSFALAERRGALIDELIAYVKWGTSPEYIATIRTEGEEDDSEFFVNRMRENSFMLAAALEKFANSI